MILKLTGVSLTDWHGKPLSATPNTDFRSVLVSAVSFEGLDLPMNADEKLRAYNLGKDIMTQEEIELSDQDIAFIKPRLVKLCTPLVYGQIITMLEK